MNVEVWTAMNEYCEAIGELSLSFAVRRLVRERLLELGYLKDKISPAPKTPKESISGV